MKITAQSIPAQSMAVVPRDGARASVARKDKASDAQAPVETPGSGRPVDGPPGLQRVLARLDALGEAGRTAGQSQAFDRISRNLARYLENQAMAPLPQPQPQPQPDTGAGTGTDTGPEPGAGTDVGTGTDEQTGTVPGTNETPVAELSVPEPLPELTAGGQPLA